MSNVEESVANKADKVDTISYNLPEYTEKVIRYTGDGYVVKDLPMRIGLAYYATFVLEEKVEEIVEKEEATKLAEMSDKVSIRNSEEDSVKISEETEKVASESPKDVLSEEEAKAFRPDYKLLQRYVKEKDKDAIEKYGRKFGIELKKSKSPENMVKDFKKEYKV